MIDEISSGVKRLNDMAHAIQDELQEHDRLVDGVEVEIEVAQTRLEKNKREIERVLQTNSRFLTTLQIVDWCEIKTIIILFLIALFFFFLVIVS